MEQIEKIVALFEIAGKVTRIAPVGSGWINDTYRVETAAETPDYVLQRINHNVFKDVALLQTNIERVTTHIRRKLTESGVDDVERRVLRVIPTRQGQLFYFDGENYWRMMLFIARSITHDEGVTPPLAYLTGVAFGDFQTMLADIGDGVLGETIPNFHNIEFRLEGLREVVGRDPMGRLAEVQWMVDELFKRAEKMCRVQQWHREGRFPKRVTHCDTKVNNILFDEQDCPLCVIDLDTTMPGFVLSDFGDFIRTGANTGAEDDPDLERVNVDMDIFRAFAKGYVERASFLTPIERDNLPYGAQLLTYMQTVRFLADYLDGDTYYKVKHLTHNWQRSKAQFKLLQSMEAQERAMSDYIAGL